MNRPKGFIGWRVCPQGEIMSFFKVNQKCNGCLACVQNCPAFALMHLDDENKRTILHNMSLCARCGSCWRVCPEEAIEFDAMLYGHWDQVTELDILHCEICQEPIYTSNFKDTLNQKVDYDLPPLCPRHKQTTQLKYLKQLSKNINPQQESHNDCR
jgi:ferredoxin